MLAPDSDVTHFYENMASQRPFTMRRALTRRLFFPLNEKGRPEAAERAGRDRQIPPELHLFGRLSKGLSNCGCLVSGPE